MDGLDCPSCGSDDVRGEPDPGGTITLTCQACQTRWARVPQSSCPRCGKSDVEEYGAQDWVYDDPAAAETDPAASGHSLGGRTFRCRRCHNTWGQAR
jgi:formate dehydrogenase maturation protein FdhE